MASATDPSRRRPSATIALSCAERSNVALAWGLVARNAAALAEPPRLARYEPGVLSPDQMTRLLASVSDDGLGALYVLVCSTGMRQAELLGLTWRDVEMDEALVSIRRSLAYRQGAFELVEAKTDESRRTIAVGPSVVAALRAHRARQHQERLATGNGGPYDGLVFTDPRGRPLHASDVLKRFYRLLSAAGLPRVRFHDLRHSHATMLLAEGWSLEDVKQRLGHRTIKVTSDTYSHVVRGRSRAVAEGVERALSGTA